MVATSPETRIFDPGIGGDLGSKYSMFSSVDLDITSEYSYPVVLVSDEDYSSMIAPAIQWTHALFAASLNMYASRVPFTQKELLYQFLGNAGMNQEVLLHFLRHNVHGLPPGVTEKSIRKYWRNVGPDDPSRLASITKQRFILRDYDIPRSELKPNQCISIDGFEAKFSKLKSTTTGRMETIPALNGDMKVILAICYVTGSVRLFTAKDMKKPEILVARIIRDYAGSMIEFFADAAFLTIEALATIKDLHVHHYQFVPGQHDIYGGQVEGIGRWVKEKAQENWNHILVLVSAKELTIVQAKPLWRHCWIFAVQMINLRPSMHNKNKMRFEYVHDRKFSLINDVMMPFMTKLIVKKLADSPTGRGSSAYYLCSSSRAGTAIVVYDPATQSTSIVAPFKVSIHNQYKDSQVDMSQVARAVFGNYDPNAYYDIPNVETVVPNIAEDVARISNPVQDSNLPQDKSPVANASGGGVGISNDNTSVASSISRSQQRRLTRLNRIRNELAKSNQLAQVAATNKSNSVLASSSRLAARNKVQEAAIALQGEKYLAAEALLADSTTTPIDNDNKGLAEVVAELGPDTTAVPAHTIDDVISTTIEEASTKFRNSIANIRNTRVAYDNGPRMSTRSQAAAKIYDDVTNYMISNAVDTVNFEYAYIIDRHLSDTESLLNEDSIKSINVNSSKIFNKDPTGSKAAEDRRVMEEFAKHNFAFILQEEIEYSEKVVCMADLVDDLTKREEAEDAAEALTNTDDPLKRPPKPDVPIGRIRKSMPLWIDALQREVAKLVTYGVMQELPKDENGKYIQPKNAIVQRLIEVAEYKWKTLPGTQLKGWLECIRIVVNGSVDKRPDSFYALTPDRTCLFIILSITATLGHPIDTSDVERAYLQALSIDKNLVVIAAQHMFPLAPQSLLIKALYGSKGGALGWEIHIDNIMISLGYEKCVIARGVYIKYDLNSGDIIRVYRHSDDLFLTCEDPLLQRSEGVLIKAQIGMSPWEVPTLFLGIELERRDHVTGDLNPIGKLVLLRQTAKIEEIDKVFAPAFEKYFPRKRPVPGPLPLDYNKDVALLSPLFARLCTPTEITLLQSAIGNVIWINSSTKRDISFHTFWIASRVVDATVRDLYNALFLLKYIIQHKDVPLILGGAGPIDYFGMCDCSLGTGPKGRSIINYSGFLNAQAGAIASYTQSTHFALMNISHSTIPFVFNYGE